MNILIKVRLLVGKGKLVFFHHRTKRKSILTFKKKFNYRNFNPLLRSVHCGSRLAKISISIQEGIMKKISYERRDYDSVDEKSLS